MLLMPSWHDQDAADVVCTAGTPSAVPWSVHLFVGALYFDVAIICTYFQIIETLNPAISRSPCQNFAHKHMATPPVPPALEKCRAKPSARLQDTDNDSELQLTSHCQARSHAKSEASGQGSASCLADPPSTSAATAKCKAPRATIVDVDMLSGVLHANNGDKQTNKNKNKTVQMIRDTQKLDEGVCGCKGVPTRLLANREPRTTRV